MPADTHLPPICQPPRSLWVPVTVRVAWELVVAGIRARPQVLADAREHVFRCLPPGVGAYEAEVLASVHTRDFLRRAREGRYSWPEPDPDLGMVVPRQWRDRLFAEADPEGQAVLQLHHADGLRLEEVERIARVDRTALAAAREGLREAIREVAADAVEGWSDARVDRLLARIAAMAEPGCPGPVGLVSGAARAHADRCPRCTRALRLLRASVIDASSLFAPQGPLVPEGQTGVLALLLHPDGRRHRAAVERAIGGVAVPAASDGWLVPADAISTVSAPLALLCAESTPPRHHLRGALLRGPGRWSNGVLLGPLPAAAIDAARSRHWAEVDHLGELPAPLPVPPRATAWWAAAALLGAACVAAAAWVSTVPPGDPLTPVEAEFAERAGAWDVRFDASDLAVIDVVALDAGRLWVYRGGARASKGAWATGDGAFALRVPGEGVAVVASPDGIPELRALLDRASDERAPLAALDAEVRALEIGAAVAHSGAGPIELAAR